MRTLLAVVCVVLLCTWLWSLALAQDKPKGTPLTGEEMKAMFTSDAVVILDGRFPSSPYARFSIFFLPDGTAFIVRTVAGPAVERDTGTWRVVADTFCHKWSQQFGVERCRKHYRVGDNAFETWTLQGRLSVSYSLRH